MNSVLLHRFFLGAEGDAAAFLAIGPQHPHFQRMHGVEVDVSMGEGEGDAGRVELVVDRGVQVVNHVEAIVQVGQPGEQHQVQAAVVKGVEGHRGGGVLQNVGVLLGRAEAGRLARASDTQPDSASFAVRASTAWSFLEAQGVRAEQLAPASAESESAPLEERARGFTVVLECRR